MICYSGIVGEATLFKIPPELHLWRFNLNNMVYRIYINTIEKENKGVFEYAKSKEEALNKAKRIKELCQDIVVIDRFEPYIKVWERIINLE